MALCLSAFIGALRVCASTILLLRICVLCNSFERILVLHIMQCLVRVYISVILSFCIRVCALQLA